MIKQPKVTPITAKKPKTPVEGLFCAYPHRVCMHNRLDGFEYCNRHILEDKNAPYKQCSYISNKNNKRCPNAASKGERKDGFCLEHAKHAMAIRQKHSRRPRPKECPETLLEELDHFKTDVFYDGRKGKNSTMSSRILEYGSSSDSDNDCDTLEQTWRDDADSDAESIDSDQEDLLKHAGVYTAEEVAVIMRDKLIRLQSLYIDQFKRLQHVMKEKRRKFLQSHKIEKETFGSLAWYKSRPESKDKYEELKASKRYHKRYGKEAILHRQSKQRRMALSEGTNYRQPLYSRCIYMESPNVKCSLRAVPLSKYCRKHILSDRYQVLFRPCQFGGDACIRPVVSIEEDAFCSLHTPLTENKKRYPPGHNVEQEGLLDKSVLLNTLDAINKDALLAQHLVINNPEMPESIFSTDPYEESQVAEPQPTQAGDASSSSFMDTPQPGTSSNEIDAHRNRGKMLPKESTEKLEKRGPLLLQHLQGTINTCAEARPSHSIGSSTSSAFHAQKNFHNVEDEEMETETLQNVPDEGKGKFNSALTENTPS